MNVKEFINSIYLGDRACKKITIDSWSQEISVDVDTISRIRSLDGEWNYYDAEDILNGQLIFENVKKVFFDDNGYIPNDRINYLDAEVQEDGTYLFTLSIDSVSDDGVNHEVKLIIISKSISIRDPINPAISITD